jgi:SAM-dependent methyltransferase
VISPAQARFSPNGGLVPPLPARDGPRFAEATAYENFIGPWSGAVGIRFLEWLNIAPDQRWLDVGCGTGAFTRAIARFGRPSSIDAIDPEPHQIALASTLPEMEAITYRVADVTSLPFEAHSFDVVTAGLVMNFVPEPRHALREMQRVGRPGAIVGAYVWDFENELSPSGPLRKVMRQLGLHVPEIPGSSRSSSASLANLFGSCGLVEVETTVCEITVAYDDFDLFWRAQTESHGATTPIITALPDPVRQQLARRIRDKLVPSGNTGVSYPARANLVKALLPLS